MAGLAKTAVNAFTAIPRAAVGIVKAVGSGSVAEGGEAFQRGALKGGKDFPSPGGSGFTAGGKAGRERELKQGLSEALASGLTGPTPTPLETPPQTSIKFDESLKNKPRRGGSILTPRTKQNPFPFISS